MRRGDKDRFLSDWYPYVDELVGPLTRQEAWKAFTDERDLLLTRFASGGLVVWRHVRLPADSELSELQDSHLDLGRYWTTSEQVAREWDGRSSYDEDHPAQIGNAVAVLLMAEVDLADIDLVETIACRLGSSWEEEIRVLPNRPLRITSVERLGKLAPTLG